MATPAEMDAAIAIKGLVKRFDDVTALDGIDATIRMGQLTGLVGPDGAGKTTLLRIAAGLMSPTAGTVRLLGFDVATEADRIHAVTGYMPQRFGLYEDLSVEENLRLYASLHGMRGAAHRDDIRGLLEFTRLEPFLKRLAGRLSGGMKQKLGLACALLARPRVLLLDEPSVGVDPVSRQDLWRMVGELVGDGIAVVWSTAYLDEAERCAEVLLLHEGKVAFAGPPAQLTERIANRTYLIDGIGANRRNVLVEVLDSRATRDAIIEADAIRVVLAETAGRSDLEALAASHGAHLEPTAPRFEDAFIDLLGGGPGGHSELADRMQTVDLDVATVVECRDLTRRFGDFVATDHVSFEVAKGEIFGLLGPNGAGKSTTFKMLCGLLEPSAGSARVAGLDLRQAASEAKSHIGYMAQKFSLYGVLSVRQNLEFFAGIYGLDGRRKRERIAEMVETFGLERYLGASPDALPLGFRQRLALACAVLHRPAVLFLDEPTSGVDPITRREFWTHINGLVRKGVTVMVTTHFMDETEYCDRVALMYRARLLALDTPDGLKRRAATPAQPNPTMETAFVHLIESAHTDEERAAA
jgi:ABC-2 type transport system ATP-binding protein